MQSHLLFVLDARDRLRMHLSCLHSYTKVVAACCVLMGILLCDTGLLLTDSDGYNNSISYTSPEVTKGTAVMWVLSADGYASCNQPSRILRAVTSSLPTGVEFVVAYNGFSAAQVKQILQKEHLSPERVVRVNLISKMAGLGSSGFSDEVTDSILIYQDGRVTSTWNYRREALDAAEVLQAVTS